MSSTFFEDLDFLEDSNEKLDFLLKLNDIGYDYIQEAQPEAILQHFYKCKTDSTKIANTMIQCFGVILLCRDSSFRMQRFMTILDSLSMDIDNDYSEFEDRIMDLGMALYDAGVRHASEWDHEILLNLYKKDDNYVVLPAFKKINKYFESEDDSIATQLDEENEEELLNPFKALWNRIA